jgi:hypothetical protein
MVLVALPDLCATVSELAVGIPGKAVESEEIEDRTSRCVGRFLQDHRGKTVGSPQHIHK